MALIWEGSTCVLCGEKLDRPYTSTWGIPFPPEHRLAEYGDAPLHLDCIADWEDRIVFSEAYFVEALNRYSEVGHVLIADADWIFVTGPSSVIAPPDFAEVVLR